VRSVRRRRADPPSSCVVPPSVVPKGRREAQMGGFRRHVLVQWCCLVVMPASFSWRAMKHLACASDDQLVGPGALRPYDGAPPAPRKRGTVRQPAAGFFIAGSTIEDMNGVYTRVHTVRMRQHEANRLNVVTLTIVLALADDAARSVGRPSRHPRTCRMTFTYSIASGQSTNETI
jgi:hypothetical protein